MAFQFKIQLEGITNPPVWRRLLVPEHFTFLRLHTALQETFGWKNSHLFQFSPKGFGSKPVIGLVFPDPMDETEMDTVDAAQLQLQEIFQTPLQRYSYTYDFGDDWTHRLTLEQITPEKLLRAQCLEGAGACPPEDCGGAWGYENLKNILADPKHPEYREYRRWLGLRRNEQWDAGKFDLEKTRKKVARV